MMGNEFDGRTAVVTGGACGIGLATVRMLHKMGASVVIADTNADQGEALANSLGGRVAFSKVDVSEPKQVAGLIDLAVETFGGVDVMVNNAAVSSPLCRLLDDDFTDFDRIMRVNVLGVMAGTKCAARHMADRGVAGAIINLTSIGGIQAGSGVMVYRASKAAVIQFTKSAAIELACHEIRVNAIAPGNIPTSLVASSARMNSEEELEAYERAIRDQMRASRPLKREGTPDDVAEAVVYLASDRARYVTGVVLPVDGGTVAGNLTRKSSHYEQPWNERGFRRP
jgi:NAD(P)-dependent dehydrogenase (short-subunit alcohol dehydrogenase family)